MKLHVKLLLGVGNTSTKTNASNWEKHLAKVIGAFNYLLSNPGLSLGGDLGELVSLNWLTLPCFVLREKFKYIEYIGRSLNM